MNTRRSLLPPATKHGQVLADAKDRTINDLVVKVRKGGEIAERTASIFVQAETQLKESLAAANFREGQLLEDADRFRATVTELSQELSRTRGELGSVVALEREARQNIHQLENGLQGSEEKLMESEARGGDLEQTVGQLQALVSISGNLNRYNTVDFARSFYVSNIYRARPHATAVVVVGSCELHPETVQHLFSYRSSSARSPNAAAVASFFLTLHSFRALDTTRLQSKDAAARLASCAWDMHEIESRSTRLASFAAAAKTDLGADTTTADVTITPAEGTQRAPHDAYASVW